MTSKKKRKKKKKKKGHHVKVYFKFVYALLFTTFALLFEEFYCPPKGFQKFGSYGYSPGYIVIGDIVGRRRREHKQVGNIDWDTALAT